MTLILELIQVGVPLVFMLRVGPLEEQVVPITFGLLAVRTAVMFGRRTSVLAVRTDGRLTYRT